MIEFILMFLSLNFTGLNEPVPPLDELGLVTNETAWNEYIIELQEYVKHITYDCQIYNNTVECFIH